MDFESDVPRGFAPLNAATGEACQLAMQELWVVGRVLPVGARLMVRHVFRSCEPKPIEVVYTFALPRDAALRRFRVVGEGFSVRSELRTVEQAVKEYEEGLERGHLATLARQYGDGIVNLAVGNIRPGETVIVHLELVAGVEARDDGFRLRFPFTLAPAYHAKARAIEMDPGQGEIELPTEGFDDLMLPHWVENADHLHRIGFHLSVCMPGEISEISSPSHPLRIQTTAPSRVAVTLATQQDVPNRDLVLDVRRRAVTPLIIAGSDTKGVGRFVALLPSETFGQAPTGARHVVFVVDRSGSMADKPIAQALGAVRACLGALSEQDRFGIVAFDNVAECAAVALLDGGKQGREKACAFLEGIDARGGTELAEGLRAASRMLTGGGDILLFTDGQVMSTEVIIQEAKAAGIRIHCLGIGSASQDRFLALLASQTGGVSRMVTPRERVDMAAMELFSTVGRPIASEVRIEASGLPGFRIAPEPADAVYAGTPLVVFGSTDGLADGQLQVSWKQGSESKSLVLPLAITKGEPGDVLGLLQGARLITSLDAQFLDYEEGKPEQKRQQSRIAKALENLGHEFGLANRRMALVAVVERKGDKAGEIPQTQIVPVGMPQDVEFSAYFGTGLAMADPMKPRYRPQMMACPPSFSIAHAPKDKKGRPRAAKQATRATTEDVLLEVAARLEPDGGLPGGTHEDRIIASLLAVLLFAEEGHTAGAGAFMPHVQRLLSFLETANLSSFSEKQQALLTQTIRCLSEGTRLPDSWLKLVRAYLDKGKLNRPVIWKRLGDLSNLNRQRPPA